MIKYLKVAHEWALADVEVLEMSGNDFVNAIYEAKLTTEDFDKELVEADEEVEDSRRGRFIKHKYKKREYMDELTYHTQMMNALKQKYERSETKSSRSSSRDREYPSRKDYKDISQDKPRRSRNGDKALKSVISL